MRRREFIALVGGAAVAWPLQLRTQQPAMPVIGFLSIGSPQVDVVRLAAFRQALKESGYMEGHNVAIEYRAAEDQQERLSALATDLVRHPVSVIVVVGPAIALADKAETTTVPIVFSITSDPVELGLVASLRRPGGNVTGITTLASTVLTKQFEILHEMMPRAVLIGILVDPTNTHAESEIRSMQAAADLFGRKLLVVEAGSEREIETAFAALVEIRAGALAVGNSALFNSRPSLGTPSRPDQLVTFAARHAGGRRNELRIQPCRRLSPNRPPRGAHSQRRAACRPARDPSHKGPIGDQPQECQDARPHSAAFIAPSRRRGDRVRRREFIAGFGGAAASVLAAHAQQTAQKAWRIGYLSEATRAPDETFRQSLRKLGYTEGSNLTTSEILVSKQKFA